MDISRHLLVVLILSVSSPGWCTRLEEVASSLYVSFTLNENYSPEPDYFTATLSLRNLGEGPIQNGTWNIYFCSIRMVDPKNLIGDNIVPRPEGYKLGTSGFTVYHIAGCLFRLAPNEYFVDIPPNSERVINYVGEFWQVARTDVMPNFYVATADGRSAPIRNTMDNMINFASPQTLPQQYKRLEIDQFAPYTPQQRYDRYVADDLGESPDRLIPQPRSVQFSKELTVQIDSAWVVYHSFEASSEASYLAGKLGISVIRSIPPTNFIELSTTGLSTLPSCEGNDEAYSVEIEAGHITVTGANLRAVFHGVQTLLAALSEDKKIGVGNIQDCPRFPYRGFMVDVARHFLPMEEILEVLDVMAMYKLNKFHFHLSDDEGFRVEIPLLPELTTVGATQCHDPVGDDCIMPQLGSPPTKESSGSGFYTVEEYQYILQYANNLHIQVIPEIDMPGHAHAIIKAMEFRKRVLNDSSYVLWDPEDATKYLSVQYFTDNAMNPCVESTYTFVVTMMESFMTLHAGIQELEIFHWGGDEVPGAWLHSPACVELAEREPSIPRNFTMKDIKGYFVNRVQVLASSRGLDTASWEDGVVDGNGAPMPLPIMQKAYVNAWSNVWEWGAGARAYVFANSGYQSIINHATHFYFDHPVEPDPEDRGYYWATRFSDSYKTFSYVASDIYKNIGYDRFGARLDPNDVCPTAEACPPLERPENMIGIQGQIWCESTRTPEHFESMVYPRIVALAERAWHQADWESEADADVREQLVRQDWQGFANRMGYRELQRLDALGIKYDVRPPAVLIEDNNLRIKTEFPGLGVEYSTDWGITWSQYYPGMPVPDTDAIFVTKSADGTRRSRSMKYNAP